MTWYCPPGTMSKPGRAITLLPRQSALTTLAAKYQSSLLLKIP
jgi:hypothetical protein